MKAICVALCVAFTAVAVSAAMSGVYFELTANPNAAPVLGFCSAAAVYSWCFYFGSALVAAVLFAALVVSDAVAAVNPRGPSVHDVSVSIARAIAAAKQEATEFEMPPPSADEALARLRKQYPTAKPPR